MNFYEQIFSRGRATGEGMTHFERLFAAKFGGSPPPEVREYTGIVPVTIMADGTPLIDYLITGNTTQNGTPTPDNPIMPQGCGELDSGQYKIPILSNSTTTNIYLGEVESTRRIKKLVLDGTENWQNYGQVPYTYRLSISNTQSIGNPAICSHFVNSSISEIASGKFTVGSTWIYFRYEDVSDLADFKAYLQQQYAAGTPVCVWYALSTEETAVVNEPLMKIGDYADTLSKAQAGVSIPTNNGSTTVDVDTTVKPSEVYLKYMG